MFILFSWGYIRVLPRYFFCGGVLGHTCDAWPGSCALKVQYLSLVYGGRREWGVMQCLGLNLGPHPWETSILPLWAISMAPCYFSSLAACKCQIILSSAGSEPKVCLSNLCTYRIWHLSPALVWVLFSRALNSRTLSGRPTPPPLLFNLDRH